MLAIKKTKLKLKPRFYLIILLLIMLIVFFQIPKNYNKKYKIDNYEIQESFNSKSKRYNITLVKDDKIFDYNFTNKYIGKKIIKNIEEITSDNTYCIKISLKKNDDVIKCINDLGNIDYHLVSDIDFSNYKKNIDNLNKQIDNITLYNLVNKSYLIWNYNSFKYIYNDEVTNFNLFNSDYYNISLATKINDYLVIPNYDSLYNFKELILINLKNKSKDTWKLNYDVSFESYVLGTYKDSIYLVDKKNKVEYELNIKKREMNIIGTEERDGKILIDNKFEKISMYKLVNNILSFENNYDQEFIIDNNNLYLKTNNTKELISNKNISKIIYQNNDYVYYLVSDTLYYYDYSLGEVRVMKNFEWNFNSNNIIFIY